MQLSIRTMVAPKGHALIKTVVYSSFFVTQIRFFENGSLLYENGSLFYENGSLFYKTGNLFYENGSLFFENGSLLAETKRSFPVPLELPQVKTGVHLKAVLMSLNIAFLPISRSRFKRR